MVIIQNSEAIKAIRDAARLSVSEGFPQILGNVVAPVMDMTPDFHRKTSFFMTDNKTTTGTLTVSLGPRVGDVKTYLTGIRWGMIKNVTCDSATGFYGIAVRVDGTYIDIVRVPILTLTAQNENGYIPFDYPLLIDNVDVVFTGTFTAGACVRSLALYGFDVIN